MIDPVTKDENPSSESALLFLSIQKRMDDLALYVDDLALYVDDLHKKLAPVLRNPGGDDHDKDEGYVDADNPERSPWSQDLAVLDRRLASLHLDLSDLYPRIDL